MKISKKNIQRLNYYSQLYRRKTLLKFSQLQQGHPGSILSIFDILTTLYIGKYIKISSDIKKNDILIISKGHAASAQYPFLIHFGLIKNSEWDKWGKGDSIFRIFANTKIKGIDATTGSLGHGIGLGCGLALSLKRKKSNKKVFVVVSEGELYEGSTWESLLFASHHKLNNLHIILDRNHLIILGDTEKCMKLEPIDKKLKSFGISTKTIDGHNFKEIIRGLNFLTTKSNSTKAIIANTKKGKGVGFMENKPEWHYWQKLDTTQYLKLIDENS